MHPIFDAIDRFNEIMSYYPLAFCAASAVLCLVLFKRPNPIVEYVAWVFLWTGAFGVAVTAAQLLLRSYLREETVSLSAMQEQLLWRLGPLGLLLVLTIVRCLVPSSASDEPRKPLALFLAVGGVCATSAHVLLGGI